MPRLAYTLPLYVSSASYTVTTMVTIDVSGETKRQIERLEGKIKQETGDRYTRNEIVRYAVDRALADSVDVAYVGGVE